MPEKIIQQRTSSPPSCCRSNSRETLRPKHYFFQEKPWRTISNTWGKCGLFEIFSSTNLDDQETLLLFPPLLLLLLLHLGHTTVPLLGKEEAVAMDLLKPGWLWGGSWREGLPADELGRHRGGQGRGQGHCSRWGGGGKLALLLGAQQEDDHHQHLARSHSGANWLRDDYLISKVIWYW